MKLNFTPEHSYVYEILWNMFTTYRFMMYRFCIFFLLFPHRIVPTIGDLQHSSLTSSIIHCIQFQVSFWSLINILGCFVCSLWRYLTYCVWFIPVYEKFFLFIAFGDKQIFGGLAGFIVSFLNLIEKNYICQ